MDRGGGERGPVDTALESRHGPVNGDYGAIGVAFDPTPLVDGEEADGVAGVGGERGLEPLPGVVEVLDKGLELSLYGG